MKKKVIGIVAAIVVVLGLSLVVYNQIIPNEYVPADDEIALHLQFDTEEDIGLLVYDYRVDSHEYSGGISNADGSLIKRDADNIVVLNKEELNNVADTFELEKSVFIRALLLRYQFPVHFCQYRFVLFPEYLVEPSQTALAIKGAQVQVLGLDA